MRTEMMIWGGAVAQNVYMTGESENSFTRVLKYLSSLAIP